MVSAMRLLGQMCSMGLATFILNRYVGHQAITPQLHSLFIASMRVVLLSSAVFCFLGVFASLARGSLRPTLSAQDSAAAR